MKQSKRTLRTIILALAIGLMGLTLYAPAAQAEPVSYAVDSNVWFEGTSSVRDWACKKVPVEATVELPEKTGSTEGLYTFLQDAPETVTPSLVEVPVGEIRCEQGETMNGHMRDALKAEKYPEISFELTDVSTQDLIDTTPVKFTANLDGSLTIKDTTRNVTIPVTVHVNEDDTIRVDGDLEMDMTNYGVTPPTVMWTITVYDEITIHVDSELKQEQQKKQKQKPEQK